MAPSSLMPQQKPRPTLSGTAIPQPLPSISVTTVREFPANHSFSDVFAELLYRQELSEATGIARLGWNGQGMRVRLQHPDAMGRMTEPYLYLQKPDGTRTPWLPSMGDLFATDWAVID